MQGLAAAHAAGATHGGYKPENLLVDRDGTTKLADFTDRRAPAAVAASCNGRKMPHPGTRADADDVGADVMTDDISAALTTFLECLLGSRAAAGRIDRRALDRVPKQLRALVSSAAIGDGAAVAADLDASARATYGDDWEASARNRLAPTGEPAATTPLTQAAVPTTGKSGMVETNIGMWLDQTLRAGAVGTWWSAATASGQPMGLLQLEPSLVAEPASRDRVAAAVTAVRTVNSRGVLRTTELVVDAKRSWLVVATRPTPTLSDLLAAAPTLAPGAAAGVAVDVGQALRDLHAVGLSSRRPLRGHRRPHRRRRGDAGRGRRTRCRPGQRRATSVATWSHGRRSPGASRPWRPLSEAELLLAAAATAESGDLAFAMRRLAHEAGNLPDFVARESLVDALPSVQAGVTADPPTSLHNGSIREPGSGPVRPRSPAHGEP